MMRFYLLLLALLCSFVPTSFAKLPVKPVNIYGHTMGNHYHVTWHSAHTTPAQVQAIRIQTEHRLKALSTLFSTWQADSEVSRFNGLKANTPMPISTELNNALVQALSLEKVTSGALDITVGPLVKLWGFGASNHVRTVPSPSEIARVLDYTGVHHIQLYNKVLTKDKGATEIDLAAIAKGYAVDELSRLLKSQNIRNFMINIGGEIKTAGHQINKKTWTITIENPIPSQRIARSIDINNKAVATSGDYRNFFNQDGTHYSHIIDAKTGRSVPRDIISATVISDECATADGLATALIAMGTEDAVQLSATLSLPVMLISYREGQVDIYETPEFKQFTF